MRALTNTERDTLNYVAAQLSIPPEWLEDLIIAESGFDPKAANEHSSAKGLIQFIDSTAQGLGFKNSLDLITKYPTITTQLRTPVYDYLKSHQPFPTKQSFYLAVFYPKAREESLDWEFPADVQTANAKAGIVTVADYMEFIDGKAEKKKERGTKENIVRYAIIFGISAAVLIGLKNISET